MLQINDTVRITMISKGGVSRQRFIPSLEEHYSIKTLGENFIVLSHERYGDFTYYSGELRLRKITY